MDFVLLDMTSMQEQSGLKCHPTSSMLQKISYLWYYGGKVRYHVKVKSDYEYDTSIDLRFDCGTIPISCSRNGDVLTITGSNTSGNETYNLNLTVDLTSKKKAVFNGTAVKTGSLYSSNIVFNGESRASFYDADDGMSSNVPQGAHGYLGLSARTSDDTFHVTSCDVTLNSGASNEYGPFELVSVTPPTSINIYLYY